MRTKFFISFKEVPYLFCIIDKFCKTINSKLYKSMYFPLFDEKYRGYLKSKGQISENEIMDIMPYRYSALTVDCFFENKPQALSVHVEKNETVITLFF